VIVPDRGAFCERVGSAGLLFRYGDGRDLANKIELLLGDPSALIRLKGAAMAAEVTSMEDHASQLEKIYQEVVDCHKLVAPPDHDPRDLLLHKHRQVIERDRDIDLLRERLVERDREIVNLEARLRDMQTLEERLLEAGRAVDEKEALLQQSSRLFEMVQERLIEAGRAVEQKEMLLQQSSRALEERLAAQERVCAELLNRLAALDQVRLVLANDLEKTIGELIAERDALLRTPAARLQAFLNRGSRPKT